MDVGECSPTPGCLKVVEFQPVVLWQRAQSLRPPCGSRWQLAQLGEAAPRLVPSSTGVPPPVGWHFSHASPAWPFVSAKPVCSKSAGCQALVEWHWSQAPSWAWVGLWQPAHVVGVLADVWQVTHVTSA